MKFAIKILFYAFPFVALAAALLFKNGYIIISNGDPATEIISDMDRQISHEAQDICEYFIDSAATRLPPTGTIPLNARKYPFEQIYFEYPENNISNPIKNKDIAAHLGKSKYASFCAYCHGATGKGDGVVITDANLEEGEEGFPLPPDLTAKATVEKTDGRLFHILSAGQNLMFPVASKLSETERWAIVAFIRKMQKTANSGENEL